MDTEFWRCRGVTTKNEPCARYAMWVAYTEALVFVGCHTHVPRCDGWITRRLTPDELASQQLTDFQTANERVTAAYAPTGPSGLAWRRILSDQDTAQRILAQYLNLNR